MLSHCVNQTGYQQLNCRVKTHPTLYQTPRVTVTCLLSFRPRVAMIYKTLCFLWGCSHWHMTNGVTEIITKKMWKSISWLGLCCLVIGWNMGACSAPGTFLPSSDHFLLGLREWRGEKWEWVPEHGDETTQEDREGRMLHKGRALWRMNGSPGEARKSSEFYISEMGAPSCLCPSFWRRKTECQWAAEWLT